MESEFLSRISRQQRAFLTRTAVLERMCGPLCDAMLELSGSAEALADLVRSNLLLVPLDRRAKWYRYHHLFRDMLLAELDRTEPELIPVLRRRAAAWCMRNDLPEPALEYSIAAGDVETAADLVGRLVLPTYQQGRVSTVQRWFRWLQERGGIGKHPMAAVLASVVSAVTGRPAEAERWADVVDHWQFGNGARPDDPPAEPWAALVRAVLCRGGVKQMRADADEAVRRFAAEGIMAPIAALCQGLARMLSGDLDGGDASFADAVIIATEADAPEGLAEALSERSLAAMARNEWSRAEGLTYRALSTLRQAGIEGSYATTLVRAVAARVALRRGDVQTARQHLVSAQRTRSLLTYALPHMAVQARIELIRVHLALGDLAGARTLMQEVDELLRRRPGLGNLVGEARALRKRLAGERGSSAPGASSLTAAELRLLPMLATHLSFAEIAGELFLTRNTVSSQAMSIYRKLGVGSRSQAVARSRELGLLEGLHSLFHAIYVMTFAWARDGMVLDGKRRNMSQTARFQETLRSLAMIDEGFVKSEAGLALGAGGTSALTPKTAALLQVGASVTIGSSPVCLQWSVAWAMTAGATEDEIADVLLAIAPVAGLGRIAAAAPDMAIALGYDVAAALEELD